MFCDCYENQVVNKSKYFETSVSKKLYSSKQLFMDFKKLPPVIKFMGMVTDNSPRTAVDAPDR